MKKILFVLWILSTLPGVSLFGNTPSANLSPTYSMTGISYDTIGDNYILLNGTRRNFTDSSKKYRNIFKVTPLKRFSVFNPSVEISFERKTGRGYSSQLMASVLSEKNVWGNKNEFGTKGYRFGFEERYFFPHQKNIGSYLGLEADYLNSNRKAIASFTEVISDSLQTYNNYEDTFGLQ